jgi:elongation factor 1-beta
LLFNSE